MIHINGKIENRHENGAFAFDSSEGNWMLIVFRASQSRAPFFEILQYIFKTDVSQPFLPEVGQ